jgi:hypothetical protein
MHGLIPEMVYQSGNFKSAVFSVFFVVQSMPLHNTSRQTDLACGNNNKGWVWNIPGLLRLEQRWKKERACFARVNGSPFPLRSLLLVGTCLCWWVSADVGRLRGKGSTKADRSYSGVAGWRWVKVSCCRNESVVFYMKVDTMAFRLWTVTHRVHVIMHLTTLELRTNIWE